MIWSLRQWRAAVHSIHVPDRTRGLTGSSQHTRYGSTPNGPRGKTCSATQALDERHFDAGHLISNLRRPNCQDNTEVHGVSMNCIFGFLLKVIFGTLCKDVFGICLEGLRELCICFSPLCHAMSLPSSIEEREKGEAAREAKRK